MQFLSANARRVVIKIGTNTLAEKGRGIHLHRLRDYALQIAGLKQSGLEVIVVSSGAIGLGMEKLSLDRRPKDISTLQACAAIGQPLLMSCWLEALEEARITGAEVLLTREDVRGRRRHLSVRQTLDRLLKLGIVPVVNENDTVSADEIKFGDNDILSALVASLMRVDLLMMLSTIPGLMNRRAGGELVAIIPDIDANIRAMAGGAESQTSVGGMISKIEAAAIATQSGCGVFIGQGNQASIIAELASGNATGSFFLPHKLPISARKRWIAFFERPSGKVMIDSGAEKALREDGRSLLAKGVTAIEGEFAEGDVIAICDPRKKPFARGISGFSSGDLQEILGTGSEDIRKVFPHRRRFEVVHRNGFVLL